jgi:hypothetical protein
MEHIKKELIEKYLSNFKEKNTNNIHDCISFILNCVDDSINQAQNLPVDGASKKAVVISIIYTIYNAIISKNLPVYLKPFDSIIKIIVIQFLISNIIDFLVHKYNEGTWNRKESNYASQREKNI